MDMSFLGTQYTWHYNEEFSCWCLENVLYTEKAAVTAAQCMNIVIPGPYMQDAGVWNDNALIGGFTVHTAPVIFENNASGYREMPPAALGEKRDESAKYLKRGMIYVSCGCRGRNSVDGGGRACGKSPWTLVDLKTAIRFLRHHAAELPGDFSRIISVSWSAGGAMSALLGVTGDDPAYLPYLAENGACMEESDTVYAAQIYCPITDLEHADLAYEWQYGKDLDYEDTPAAPAGTLSPFQQALSEKLAIQFVQYFNSLRLRDPETGAILQFDEDGRSGSGYTWLMARLEEAAQKYLTCLAEGRLEETFRVEDYLRGAYSRSAVRCRRGPDGPIWEHVDIPGRDKSGWLSWDGKTATIRSLDAYIRQHRGRMKPCPAFDGLHLNTAENQEFGTPEEDRVHFSLPLAEAMKELEERWPEECRQYSDRLPAREDDKALEERLRLLNPMHFTEGGASWYRIRVGACDADTSFAVSMILALKLANAGKRVDYALVWDQPHCEADYPDEICNWIEQIL